MKLHTSFFAALFISVLCAYNSVTHAQNTKTWEWANSIYATNLNSPYSLYTDKDGNSYIAGSFSDTLRVGNDELISRGSFDIYLLKFFPNGSLDWAKQSGGTGADEAYAITSDASGNIYLTGYFSGTANFGSLKVESKGDRDYFVSKYDKNGEPVWVKSGGGTLEDFATAINCDLKGNVFITGIFKGDIELGTAKYTSKGDKDIFIVKYSPLGEIVWSKTGGGNRTDETTALVTDAIGNLYVAGDFEGTADFSKKIIVSTGSKDVLLAKYDTTGQIVWLRREGSATGDDHATAIAMAADGSIYLSGYFSGTAYFGKLELKNASSDDVFLVKYNSDGDVLWAKQTGGEFDEHARAMKLDKDGNILVAGEYNAGFTFGENHFKNMGDWNIFILKYNSSGEIAGGAEITGAGMEKAFGLGLDSQSNVYIAGFFSTAAIFGDLIIRTVDENDGFIAKLKGL